MGFRRLAAQPGEAPIERKDANTYVQNRQWLSDANR